MKQWTTILGIGAAISVVAISWRRKRTRKNLTEPVSMPPSYNKRFTNKTVLITGAAGDIGSATAAAFAQEGATLVLVDLPSTKGKLVNDKDQLLVEGAKDVIILAANMTQSDQVEEMVSDTLKKTGNIDCFFNNAGIQGELLPLHEQSDEQFEETISVNLIGVFLGMKYVSKAMIAAGKGGVIVNTSSLAGLAGPANMAAYSASKFGVTGLTKTGAKDLAPHDIRVCAIAPGLIEGRLWHRQVKGKAALRIKSEGREGGEITDEDVAEQEMLFLKGTPLNRIGRLSEVANVVKFLCSQDASYITGTVISIDGGRLM
jgi:NAD(P)-dependent dehydrogenase (short-subunit alcohol dehydrogenase family)